MKIKNKNELCDWRGCRKCPGPCHFIYGDAYCYEHYSPALEEHFFKEYTWWNGKNKPDGKFLNVFSRYVEDLYKDKEMPGGLSKGRLNHRIYKIRKTKNGVNFSIVRHKNAWKHPENMHEVVQRWSFSIKRKKLKLLSEKS